MGNERPGDRLEDLLCFAVYSASNAITRRYTPLLAPLDLTYPQMLVLKSLWQADAVSMSRISSLTLLDAGMLTEVVKKLERKGLITKASSKSDGRSKIISLTRKGRALEADVANVLDKIHCEIGLTNQEEASILIACKKIIETFE